MSDDTTNAAATDNVFTLAKLEEAMAKIRALGPLPPVIRESAFLTERHEDWSRVRSPGRAARRLQQGHRQNIDLHQAPMSGGLLLDGVLYVHPLTMLKIKGSAV
jgi:hypothetical protein